MLIVNSYIELLKRFDELREQSESIEKIEAIIDEVAILENKYQGEDIHLLITELQLRLKAYKLELEKEVLSEMISRR